MSRAPTAAGVAAGLLAGALAMRALWYSIPPQLAAQLPAQPIPVPTEWHEFGALLSAAILAGIALATPFYLHASGGAPAWRSPWTIAAWSSLALACAWMAPAILSSDVYAYAVYGTLARAGSNPYAHHILPHGNPLYAAAIVQWGNPIPVCVYGLPFVAAAAVIVAITAPLGTMATLDGFRMLSALAFVSLGPLAFAAFGGDRRRRTLAAATIALNPASLWCAAEGHNDALAVAVALAGFALVRRGSSFAGALTAALAGAVKLPGLFAALPAAYRRRAATWGAVAGSAIALGLSAPVAVAAFAQVAPAARYAPQASLQAVIVAATAPAFGGKGASVAAWAVAGAASVLCLISGWRRLRRRDAEGWAYAAAGAWLLVPNPYPWYGLWLLPVAAAVPGTAGAAALVGLSLTSALRYLPDAAGAPGIAGAIALGCAATLPVLGLLRRSRLV